QGKLLRMPDLVRSDGQGHERSAAKVCRAELNLMASLVVAVTPGTAGDGNLIESTLGKQLSGDLLARQAASGDRGAVLLGHPPESLRGPVYQHGTHEDGNGDQERETSLVKPLDQVLEIHQLSPPGAPSSRSRSSLAQRRASRPGTTSCVMGTPPGRRAVEV